MSKPFDKTKPFTLKGDSDVNIPERAARILSDDFKSFRFVYNEGYKVLLMLVVAVEGKMYDAPYEHIMIFNQDGTSECGTYRLVNVPIKKTGWVNIYKDQLNSIGVIAGIVVFNSEAEAKIYREEYYKHQLKDFVGCSKIEWEE